MVKISVFKLIFSFLLVASTSMAQQQPVKKKTDAYANNTFEEYYVLKSDKTMRHGLFLRTRNELVLAKGYYNMGQQDSTWIYYSPNLYNEHRMTGKGQYKQGKKVGKWQYYNEEGAVEQIYDHSDNKLLFQKGLNGENSEPIYVGGKYSLRAYMDNMQYPYKAIDDNVKGDVVVEFTVDTNGIAGDFRVKHSLRQDCDDTVLKMLRSLPEKWIPAMANGKPKESEYTYTEKIAVVIRRIPVYKFSGR